MASTTKQMNITAGNAQATVNATVNDSMPAIPCPDPAGYRYVGARYVPLFADPLEWSSANTYEPLTIVTHEGYSYTSRTHVPTGIDISNTDYWALTGNYNAQIEQYRQEVQKYVDQVNAYNQQFTDINNKLDDLEEKHYLIAFGDSWVNPNGGTYYGWVENLAAKLNLNSKNFGDGGAAIGGGPGTGTAKSVRDQIAKAIDDDSFDNDKVDHVIIVAGVNDFSGATLNVKSYIGICIDIYNSLHEAFPNAHIKHYQDMCLNVIGNSEANINRCYNFFQNIAKIQSSLAHTGIYSLELYKNIATAAGNYNDDHLHPNATGNKVMVGVMYADITGVEVFNNVYTGGGGCGIRVNKTQLYLSPTETQNENLTNYVFRTFIMIEAAVIFSNGIPCTGNLGNVNINYLHTSNTVEPTITINNPNNSKLLIMPI